MRRIHSALICTNLLKQVRPGMLRNLLQQVFRISREFSGVAVYDDGPRKLRT